MGRFGEGGPSLAFDGQLCCYEVLDAVHTIQRRRPGASRTSWCSSKSASHLPQHILFARSKVRWNFIYWFKSIDPVRLVSLRSLLPKTMMPCEYFVRYSILQEYCNPGKKKRRKRHVSSAFGGATRQTEWSRKNERRYVWLLHEATHALRQQHATCGGQQLHITCDAC